MKKNKVTVPMGLSLVVLLALVCFPRLGSIANSDSYLAMSTELQFFDSFFIWSDSFNGGHEASFNAFLFPVGFAVLLNKINLAISNAGLILLVILLTWYVTYKFVDYVLNVGDDGAKKLIVFLISSYSVSIAANRIFLIAVSNVLWGNLFLVLGFFLYYRYLKELRIKWLILAALAFVFSYLDVVSAIMLAIFILTYSVVRVFLHYLGGKSKEAWIVIVGFLKYVGLLMVINSYWLVYTIYSNLTGKSRLRDFVGSVSNTDNILRYITALTNSGYSLILSRENFFNGKYYVSWLFPIDIIGSFVIFALVVSGMIWLGRHKLKNDLLPFFILVFIFLTLGFGKKDPTGIFNLLWNYFPGFEIFRDFYKFHRMLAYIYPLLASFSALQIYGYIKDKKLKTIFTLSFCFLLLKFLPLYFLFPLYKPFKVPQYYFDLQKYLDDSNEDVVITIFPLVSWHQKFEWSNQDYDMPDPLFTLSPLPSF